MPFALRLPDARRLSAFALVLLSGLAQAAPDEICPGDYRLKALEGSWADTRLIAALPRLRNWPQALDSVDPLLAGVIVRRGNVALSLGWHDRDPGGHCLHLEGENLWLHPVADRTHPIGPYQRVATADDSEALSYLARIVHGCFRASSGARWCFSPREITVDGQPFDAEFTLDALAMPDYGTSLVTRDARLPLVVLVPQGAGFALYRDDWVVMDGHRPVVPGRDAPWLVLQPE